MPAATLTSKGQVTIPAEVRAALGVGVGDRLEFVATAAGAFEIVPATSTVRALRGLVSPPATTISVEEMNKAIAERGGASR